MDPANLERPRGRPSARPWAAFQAALERTLAAMADGSFLILSASRSGRCVQFAAQGADGFRAEVIGNHFLPEADRLDDDEVARLLAEGWQPPTHAPEAARPERDPAGSPNFFVALQAPVDHRALARRAVRTLRALGFASPSELEYDAFVGGSGAIDCPALGLERARATSAGRVSVAERLLSVVRVATGIPGIELDADGDVPVRYGTVLAFVRAAQAPQRVCFFAPLLRDVRPQPALLERLNELNFGSNPVRFMVRDTTVFGYAEIPADPFVAAHVESVLHQFCARCDGIGPWLASRFGGEAVPALDGATCTMH